MIDRYYRNEGYSTDGYFLIKTELENAYLRRQKIEGRQPMTKTVVDRAHDGEVIQVYNIMDFRLDEMDCIKFSNGIVINKHFLKYFNKCKNLTFHQSQTYKYQPIILKNDGEFVGLIMPIRTQ